MGINNKIFLNAVSDKKTDKRNYGIDFLRIMSMFFIVILHSLGHGGVLTNVLENTIQYKAVWLCEIIAYCAVDIFAIISGYVSHAEKEKEVKVSNYIKLWMQVVFYSVIITLFFNIYNKNYVSKGDYLNAIFPVTKNLYWYFTAYTGLFIFMPLINKSIRYSDNTILKKVLIIIIISFSIINTKFNIFYLNYGYSLIWLLILYILGATIKKCELGKNLKKFTISSLIIGLYLLTYLNKLYGLEEGIITKDYFISYTSPTILIIAILYVIGFSKIQFNCVLKKIINFFATSAFSVYLINDNPLVRKYVVKDLFVNIVNYPILKIVFYIIAFSLLFLILSVLLDKMRILLFRILHLDKLINFFCKFLSKLLNIIV